MSDDHQVKPKKTSFAQLLISRAIQLAILAGFFIFLKELKWDLVIDNAALFLEGIWVTIQLTILSLLFGFLIALPLALIRAKRSPKWAAWIADGYVAIFRGSPLLVQVFLIYYGLGGFEFVRESIFWPILREAYWCVLIGFSLNSGAYACEIFRGALVNGGMGEREAAMSLGLKTWQVDWLVWIPAALRRALPQYGNEMVFMLHGTAIAGLVTLTDIFGAGKEINSKYYSFYEGMIPAALLYMALTFLIAMFGKWLEKRYLRFQKP